MEARTGRTNCVYLVCPTYYYVQGQPTQIQEDGDPYISWGGSLQGHSLLTNILLWLEALPWSWSKLIYFIPFWATVKPTRATVTQLELSA